MLPKSNCHTHTTYCDGKSFPAELAEAATTLGFVSLGFSGHSPLPFESGYAMPYSAEPQYNAEIERLKLEYSGRLDILRGLEWDLDSKEIQQGDYDFVIGAVHQLKKGEQICAIDHSAQTLQAAVDGLYGGSWFEMARAYYSRVLKCALKPYVDIVAHFDLITKYNNGFFQFNEDSKEYISLALECVDAIIDSRPELLFEVNTGAMNRAKKQRPYPAPFILKRLHERNAQITITSDCHSADSIDFNFGIAADACRAAGYSTVFILTSGGRQSVQL